MPIRIASMTKRISQNGQDLRHAMMSRGEGEEPTAGELALIEERRLLKEERDKRKAQALLPRASAVDRLQRTQHAQGKDKPKASKEADGAREAKKPKPRMSRAEKHAQKAQALEAARRAPKKPTAK